MRFSDLAKFGPPLRPSPFLLLLLQLAGWQAGQLLLPTTTVHMIGVNNRRHYKGPELWAESPLTQNQNKQVVFFPR